MTTQPILRSLILTAIAVIALTDPMSAQCSSISVFIGSTGHYYQQLDSYQTFTMPSSGLVTGFTFYGVVPGGQSGNITYRVYRMPEDTLLATATIFETGVGETYYGANFGYQTALYFAAGAQLKIRINGPSLAVLNKLYYANNNPYSGGVSSAAGGGPWDLACRLYTSVAPSLSFSTSSIFFGTLPVGTPKTDTLVVTNPGCYTLYISSVSKSNSQFAVTPTSATIAAGGSQAFYVTYTSSAAASVADSLTFVSDAPSNGTQKVPLSGTGVFQGQTNAANGLTFDGTNDFVLLTNSAGLQLTTGTVEAWVKTSNSVGTIFFKAGAFGMGMSSGNFSIHDWGSGISRVSSTNIADGAWHHVAFSFQSGVTNGTQLYVDGVNVLTTTMTVSNQLYAPTIGNGYPTGPSNPFNGSIDEVRLWSTIRTTAQIRENVHLSLAGNESGLLGYWRMDETSGSTAGEGTGQGYAGTLQDAPTRAATGFPLGAGESVHLTGITTGSTYVTGFSMGLVNDFDNASDVLVTRIGSNPNQLPSGSSELLEGAFFIVRVFGTPGTFSSSVTFDVPAHFTADGTASPGNYTLYSRGSNSTGSWSAAVTGLSAMNPTNITFNGLTSFSQFMVGTDNTLPVQMMGMTAEMTTGGVVLRWKTVTEVDNAGFEVERRDVSSQSSVVSRQTEAKNWEKIGFVEGAGTSTSERAYSFADSFLRASRYAYRLKQLDHTGAFVYSGELEVEIGAAPKVFALSQNYPNPFNPSTKIEFTLSVDGKAALRVFNVLGQEVATLFNGEAKAGTIIRSEFEAKGLASGMYFARLEYDGKQLLKRMMLMK